MGWPDWDSILVFLGGVGATLITVIARGRTDRASAGKANKEGEASLSEATIAWAKHVQETLNQQIATLKQDYDKKYDDVQKRLAEVQAELRIHQAHNRLLIGQLVVAGITPVDPPDLTLIGDD